MEHAIDFSKNITALGIVLTFLTIISTSLLGIVVYFLKSFMRDSKATREKVEEHDVKIAEHHLRIQVLEQLKQLNLKMAATGT